jgi:hypothetical protein
VTVCATVAAPQSHFCSDGVRADGFKEGDRGRLLLRVGSQLAWTHLAFAAGGTSMPFKK